MADPPSQLIDSISQELVAQRVLNVIRQQDADRRETDIELITHRVLDVVRRQQDADRREQQSARRWRVGITATILTTLLAAVATGLVAVFLEARGVQEAAVRDAVGTTVERVLSIINGEDAAGGIMTIGPGDAQQITLDEDEQQRFQLVIPEPGRYRIDATAVTDEFDPFLYLYDANFELLEADDDSFGGLNARIETRLEVGDYYVDVEELVGSAGTVTVTIGLVQ